MIGSRKRAEVPPTLPLFALPPAPPAALERAAVRPGPPAYMLVFAREYTLNPSRRVVPAGRVVIQVQNIGEDPHDLAVKNAAGRTIAKTPVIRSGRRAQLKLRLAAGRYTLWCRVPRHLEHGMSATFVVKKPATKPARRRA